MDFDKTLTDVPLMDEIVYHVKTMAYGTVLKDMDEADLYETVDIEKAADIYIKCIDGTIKFEHLTYPREFLETTDLSPEVIDMAVINKNNIPVNKRDEILSLRTEDYIANYEELNNYYRKLNGYPNVGEDPIYIDPADIPPLMIIDTTVPLHLMDEAIIENLDSLGIIDELREKYPDKHYLKHIGGQRVSIYDARTAPRFGVLYVPNIPISDIYNRYKSRLQLNRGYTLKAVYSEAYKMTSDYYDKFIILFIVLQTMVDMIAQLPEYIIRRDIFDIRTVQYFLEGYGVAFYEEIPLVYQVAMVRNLNKLIKWHSTTKSIIDICSLFGYDDIEIFRYYILRDRKVDINGKYIYQVKNIPDPDNPESLIEVEDLPAEYDLKFLKCPISKDYDEYIRDTNNIYEYDDIVGDDKYWDGELEHQAVKEAIIEHEFNVLSTKYISIDIIQEMTEIAIQMPYFFNMLFDNKIYEELLTLSVPYISSTSKFKLTDLICFLWSISYEYNNLEDYIMDSTAKLLYIKGFNFNADMEALGEYIASKHYTAEDLGIDGFIIPNASILSFSQLMNIFTTNVNIMKHVIYEITHADNKDIYDIYYKIYDTLCIQEYTDTFFRMPDGSLASNYKEYLSTRNITLYNAINTIESITDLSSKQNMISEYINSIIYSIGEYIDSDEYRFLWSNIPTVSGSAITKYLKKIIDFFKSYKIEILSINTIYLFNDRLENMITMIDKVFIDIVKIKGDIGSGIDKIRNTANLTYKEKCEIIEKIYIDISRMVKKLLSEYGSCLDEDLISIIVDLIKKETIDILDEKETLYFTDLYKVLLINPEIVAKIDVSLDGVDKSTIIEKIYIILDHVFDPNIDEYYTLTEEDNRVMNSVFTKNDSAILVDTCNVRPIT